MSNKSPRNAKEPDLVSTSTRSPGESEFLQQERVQPKEHCSQIEEVVGEKRRMEGSKGLPHHWNHLPKQSKRLTLLGKMLLADNMRVMEGKMP